MVEKKRKEGKQSVKKGGKLGQGVGALQTMVLKSLFYNQLDKLASQMIEMYYEYYLVHSVCFLITSHTHLK